MAQEFNDDNNTQQTLDFLNEMDREMEEVVEPPERTASQVAREGLKVTTFGEMFRESEAKKNVLALPSPASVLEQVKFELQELPEGFGDALAQCQVTKQLILDSY